MGLCCFLRYHQSSSGSAAGALGNLQLTCSRPSAVYRTSVSEACTIAALRVAAALEETVVETVRGSVGVVCAGSSVTTATNDIGIPRVWFCDDGKISCKRAGITRRQDLVVGQLDRGFQTPSFSFICLGLRRSERAVVRTCEWFSVVAPAITGSRRVSSVGERGYAVVQTSCDAMSMANCLSISRDIPR